MTLSRPDERLHQRAVRWRLPAPRLSRRWQLAAALGLFALIDVAYFGTGVLLHPSRRCACSAGSDPETYMWFLAWWPHALFGGHNPFLTTALFAPDHVNLGSLILVPAAAVLASPVTLLFGPLVTYNLLALSAPVLAAFFAYRLCRYVTGRYTPSLAGGYVFGFSPYMLGHMMGHLDLVMVFPIPGIVHLALRYLDGRITRRRCIVLMALLFAVQYLSSPELTVTFVLIGGLAFVAALALVPDLRGQLLDTVRTVLIAGVISVSVLSPFIYYALTGDLSLGFFGRLSTYGADSLGFLIPTSLERLGRAWFASVSSTFAGNLAENGIYVGLPLALITARYAVTRWKSATTRILVVVLAAVVVLSMGARLQIAGHPTLPLPWRGLRHLPLLDRVIPLRLGVYMFLIVAVLLALWLASPRSPGLRWAKWALALVGLAALIPNLGQGAWSSQPSNPRFFTSDAYRSVIARNQTVLVLPWGQIWYSMLWQAEAGFWFRMPEAYLGALIPPDYIHDPLWPALSDPNIAPDPLKLRMFLRRRDVAAVVLDEAAPERWPGALAAAGLHGTSMQGVLFYRVPK